MTSASNPPIPPRVPGLISRELGDEIVVMDDQSKQVHLLREVTAQVWHAAGGGPAPTASAEEVEAAVAEMTAAGLLQQAPGMSRRTMLQRSAIVAGVGLTTMALPTPAMAASGAVTVSLSPTSGKVGSTVVVSGTTPVKNTNYTVYFDGAVVATGKSNGTAAYSSSIVVPSTTTGVHNIRVETTGAADTGNASFTVTP